VVPIEVPVSKEKLLKNKVALISGGSGGIGMAIAESLLESNCKVILAGTNLEKLSKCEEKLENKFNPNAIKFVIFNLLNIDKFDEYLNNAILKFGKIDIFVNSAGVHIENVNFWTVTPEQFDRVMDIDLKGVYFSCIKVAKYWVKSNMKGHILLISSSRATEPEWSPYGISKLGVNGMTKGLAQVLIDKNIIVNCIAPGSTATPLLGIHTGDSIYTEDNHFHRMIMPREVATYAKLMVSAAGDMLAGETINVSAGRGVWNIR
jgi:NAD(P)-dependent dehydrogenase (short-subunit alcohol dehydrogenase family)